MAETIETHTTPGGNTWELREGEDGARYAVASNRKGKQKVTSYQSAKAGSKGYQNTGRDESGTFVEKGSEEDETTRDRRIQSDTYYYYRSVISGATDYSPTNTEVEVLVGRSESTLNYIGEPIDQRALRKKWQDAVEIAYQYFGDAMDGISIGAEENNEIVDEFGTIDPLYTTKGVVLVKTPYGGYEYKVDFENKDLVDSGGNYLADFGGVL